MKIIFISDNGSKHRIMKFQINLKIALPVLFLFLTVAFMLLKSSLSVETNTVAKVTSINSLSPEVVQQLAELGRLRAEVDRLNALGKYIALQGNINIDKFMLQTEPAIGGSNALLKPYAEMKHLSADIHTVEIDINAQEARYNQLKQLIEAKRMESDALRLYADKSNDIQLISDFTAPVPNGYTSSIYGLRRDPINGKHRQHRGIDVAAQTGTVVHAIANGFVTFVGKKGGYGNVLEITHSDSLKSRYAHLNAFNVSVGEVVRKGDDVAEVGSTGRVTGPHLHLEVWKDGKPINPVKYLEGLNYIEQ
jgi:murein DD-endopeptidase MepM/ murein hydrolase activator NlpD